MHSSHPKPQRYLPPAVADALRQAKIDSGCSWREIAVEVGRSHSFLVQIAGGKRVPGRMTAQRLIDALLLDPDTSAELLDLVPLAWWERRESGCHGVQGDHVATNEVTDVDQPLVDQMLHTGHPGCLMSSWSVD